MYIIHTFVFHVVVQQVFLICRILDIICVENSGRTGPVTLVAGVEGCPAEVEGSGCNPTSDVRAGS